MGRYASFVAAAALYSSSVYGETDGGVHSFDERAVQHVHIPAIAAMGMTAFIERLVAFENTTTVEGKE